MWINPDVMIRIERTCWMTWCYDGKKDKVKKTALFIYSQNTYKFCLYNIHSIYIIKLI